MTRAWSWFSRYSAFQAAARQGVLPCGERALELLHAELVMDEVRADAVGAHVVEGEHQLHLAVLQVVHGALHGDVVGLADDHAVVVRHAVAVKSQIIVQIRALGELLRAVGGRQRGYWSGSPGVLEI